jgi:hypothetical protein
VRDSWRQVRVSLHIFLLERAKCIFCNSWRNVDTSDPSFMTSQRVASIRLIVNHPKISLLTLNAPHACMKGVVPLGMASWLNLPRIVRLLLEESADTVSVDGMDSHGATALMCKIFSYDSSHLSSAH